MNLGVALCLLVSVCYGGVLSQLTKDRNQLLNWCLNASLHIESPAKVDALHQQCEPWKEKACCSHETTLKIHETDMHNFDLNHCASETGRNMSQKCRLHFNQDNCFYECEPHIGLWVVKTNRKIATERFVGVPLCASDCDSWFKACKDDYTCAFNWPKNFVFKKGVNSCPTDSKCITFKQMYNDSAAFCENVWDSSWKYTPKEKPCMHVWFDGKKGNPNEAVANHYITERFGNVADSLVTSPASLIFALVTVMSTSLTM